MSNGLSAELSALTIAPRGVLRSEFSTQEANSGLHLEDGSSGHEPQFALNDLLRVIGLAFPAPEQSQASTVIAHKFWLPGGLPTAALCDVWLKVTAVEDEGTHFRYDVTLQHNDGPDCRFAAGTEVIGYGQVDSQRMLLTATEDVDAFVDVFETGSTPWTQPLSLVRVGQLGGLDGIEGREDGIAIGSSLVDPKNPHIIASTERVHLSKIDLTTSDGQAKTARIGRDGSLQLGTDLERADSVGLSYSSTAQLLSVSGRLNIGGAGTFADSVSLTDGQKTTLRLSTNGDIVVASDVQNAETVGFAYKADTKSLSLAGSLQSGGGAWFAGPVSLTEGDKITLRLSTNGDIVVASDIENPEQVFFHLDPAAKRLSLSLGLALNGSADIKGNLAVVDNDRTTAMLKQNGSLLLGPNVGEASGVHVSYEPTPGLVAINVPVNLTDELVSTHSLVLKTAENRTVLLGADGTVRIGTDISEDEQTALIFSPSNNSLDSRARVRLFGNTESRGMLAFYDNGNQTIAIAPNGVMQLGSNVNSAEGTAFDFDPTADNLTLATELRLTRDAIVGGDLRLQDGAALLAGNGESVRIDRDGMQLRLEPAENNSIKVVGIGRAALINAYQTPDSMQEFDLLAYYNEGVPSLHGRIRLGVANADGGEPDTFLRMTRFYTGVRNIEMNASYIELESERIRFNGDTDVRGDFDFSGTGGVDRVFRLRNLPISPDGLPTGAVWNDGGTLKIA